MRPSTVDAGQTTNPSEQEGKRAPQVCFHCKSIKKGCDKKLPSCSQCIKRRAVCRYGEPSEPRRYGDEVVNATPTMDSSSSSSTWTSISRSVFGRLNPSMRVSILLMNSMSDIIQTSVLEPNVSQLSTSTDAIFHSQVCYIIRADGHFIEDVVTRYFNGVHSWVPIISRKRFHDRFRFSNVTPPAEYSILLLVMRLITQFPSSDPDVDQDREILYLATKTLFAQVQAFVPISLALVQCGVLLARYEQAYGMKDAAYVTCGTASRMACSLGIQNSRCSEALQGSDIWFDEEEALSTWWGLVICDRTIASDSTTDKRPLAARSIQEDDYLPLEAGEMSGNVGNLSPGYRCYVSGIALPSVGAFGRECQAAYVLDKVRIAVRDVNFDQDKLMSLGRELHSLLSTVMNQTAGRWGHYSGAIKSLIVGMYTLHWAALNSNDIRRRADSAAAIKVTLHTVTRMVIDIAHAFNVEVADCNIETLSPSIGHIVRCAQQHILMCKDFSNEQWRRDFDELRKMLNFFGSRWLLAAQELNSLNKSFESAISMRS